MVRLVARQKRTFGSTFPGGRWGVLYPAGYFSGIEFDSGKIMKLCPTADDMWLKIVGAQKRIPAVKVSTNSKE